jgi:hypothetical protein
MRVWLPLVLALLVTGTANAQSSQEPFPRPAPDFLFGRPRASIGLRGSVNFLRARSDWYDLVSNQLTLDRSSFREPGIAGDVGIFVAPRLEIVAGADFATRTTGSEYRDLVDNNRQPIVQTTRLRQATLTAGVRVPLLPRGRDISSLAWIPSRWVPYAGGGAGALYYELRQWGDFVDIQDYSVFPQLFLSQGWTPLGYVNGGVDVGLLRHLNLTIDGRYQWARATLRPDVFQGFDRHDLAGFRVSTGINVIF